MNSSSAPLFDAVGASGSFQGMIDANQDIGNITATCEYTNTINGKTLNIYVANSDWYTSGGSINQTIVNNLANKFLVDGVNDIYGWDTNIFGSEWGHGADAYSGVLIPYSKAGNITILIYDIPISNILGFFWSKDNILNSYLASISQPQVSNERLMFYINASYLNSIPSQLYSTLAHEFQHMIHFYQKAVLRANGNSSDTWINEMCSVNTEDFVANLIQSPYNVAPRGIIWSDPSTGSSNNDPSIYNMTYAPYYIFSSDYSLTNWQQEYYNYALAYSFGAYLARNYGGETLFKNIVQNQYTDYNAITNAIYTTDSISLSFAQLLQNWGVSVLLSNEAVAPSVPFQYNNNSSSTWINQSLIGTVTYNIGSINFYNYFSGPRIYNSSSLNSAGTLQSASNRFYYVGNVSGTISSNIKLDSGVQLTVVVK